MARILALDYGKVRTGIAVTDPLKIIATALETVPTRNLADYIFTYCKKEAVETIVIGLPVSLKSEDTDSTESVRKFADYLKSVLPEIPIKFIDERFTSKMAQRVMIDSGMNKKNRQVKGNVDQISAVIILQDYMNGF